MKSASGLVRFLGSGVLATVVSSVGIETAEKLEKKVAGGKALSVCGLQARHTLMAAMFRQMKKMKQRRSKAA